MKGKPAEDVLAWAFAYNELHRTGSAAACETALARMRAACDGHLLKVARENIQHHAEATDPHHEGSDAR